jgi:hypothetical protein
MEGESAWITRESPLSGRFVKMLINTSKEKVEAWDAMDNQRKPLIQNFFPELNKDEREFVLTGVSPHEWDELFGNEDE